MSSTAKLSISITDPELLAWARERAKRDGTSVSAVFADAVRLERQLEARGRVLEWLGPEATPTAEEAKAILREWGQPGKAGPGPKPGVKRAGSRK